MKNITVKNTSSSSIVLVAPNIRYRRELPVGREIRLSTEEFEELSFEPGFQNLERGGYIVVNGTEEGAVEQTKKAKGVASEAEIREILTNRDYEAFSKIITKATKAAKETVVKIAVELNVTDEKFTAPIKKYCGVDVVDAIAFKRQAEEPLRNE